MSIVLSYYWRFISCGKTRFKLESESQDALEKQAKKPTWACGVTIESGLMMQFDPKRINSFAGASHWFSSMDI